eukprot:204207-Prymnesium_polylepis.1
MRGTPSRCCGSAACGARACARPRAGGSTGWVGGCSTRCCRCTTDRPRGRRCSYLTGVCDELMVPPQGYKEPPTGRDRSN